MFILDYLIVNQGRHLGNFGIIRDVEIIKVVENCCLILIVDRQCIRKKKYMK